MEGRVGYSEGRVEVEWDRDGGRVGGRVGVELGG